MSRKTVSILLQRLAPVGTQASLAVAMGVSEATISRNKEHIEPLALMLAHLGLKVVPAEKVCVSADELKFLRNTYAVVQAHAPHLLSEDD